MSKQELEAEALSLDARWRKICSETLTLVGKNKDAWIFKDPVIESPELSHEAKVAYSSLITEPMDFRTIRKNIPAMTSPAEFEKDMLQVFRNCATFNKPGQDAFEMGKDVEHVFLSKWQFERRKDIATSLWQQSEQLAASCGSDILVTSRKRAKVDPPFYDAEKRKVVEQSDSAASSSVGSASTVFEWRNVLRQFVARLEADPAMHWFLLPVHKYPSLDVNVKKQFYQLTRSPMDFETIKLNLDNYPNPFECRRDLELIVTNSVRFNPPGSPVNTAALQLQRAVTDLFDVTHKAEFSKLSLPSEWKGVKKVLPAPPPAELLPAAPGAPTVLRLKRTKTGTTPEEPAAPPAPGPPAKQTSQPSRTVSTTSAAGASVLQIQRDMTSLPPSNQHWTVYASHCLNELAQIKDESGGGAANRLNWIFQKPIFKYELPVHIKRLYLLSVSNLIDLSVIQNKLAAGVYSGPSEFESDVQLMLDNCLVFNDETQFPHKVGFVLQKHFDKYWYLQLKPLIGENAPAPLGLASSVPAPETPNWQELQQQVAGDVVRPNQDCDSVSANFPLNEELLYEWRVSQRHVMQQLRHKIKNSL